MPQTEPRDRSAHSARRAHLYRRCAKQTIKRSLPRVSGAVYPTPQKRDRLFLILGEIHNQTQLGPVENPQWLTVPERGLFTGIAIFGAIGSGKTSGCMLPFAEQILSYRASDPLRRASALVLEVKGDFCFKVKKLLEKYHRTEDYVEVGLHAEYRYNPLHNDQMLTLWPLGSHPY